MTRCHWHDSAIQEEEDEKSAPELYDDSGVIDTSTKRRVHAKLHWTGCYEDDCTIYFLDKDYTRYFPRKKKSKKAYK